MQNKETSFRDNQKTHHPGKNRGMWHAPRGGTWGHNLLYVVLCWDTWPKIKPYGGIRQTQIEEHANPACQNCQWASRKTEADDVRPREGNKVEVRGSGEERHLDGATGGGGLQVGRVESLEAWRVLVPQTLRTPLWLDTCGRAFWRTSNLKWIWPHCKEAVTEGTV